MGITFSERTGAGLTPLMAQRIAVLLFLTLATITSASVTKEDVWDQLDALNNQQKEELDGTRQKLSQALADTEQAQRQVSKIVEERDGWHAYGDDQHEKWMNAEVRVSLMELAKNKWRLKAILAIGAIVLYIGIKFSPLGRFI